MQAKMLVTENEVGGHQRNKGAACDFGFGGSILKDQKVEVVVINVENLYVG